MPRVFCIVFFILVHFFLLSGLSSGYQIMQNVGVCSAIIPDFSRSAGRPNYCGNICSVQEGYCFEHRFQCNFKYRRSYTDLKTGYEYKKGEQCLLRQANATGMCVVHCHEGKDVAAHERYLLQHAEHEATKRHSVSLSECTHPYIAHA
jgi:hypothetical protein